jgi:hypothetical protein
VHDPGAVRLGQAVGELRPELEHLGDGEGTASQALADGLALDQLHHHVMRALQAGGLAHVVDVDDVGMVEGRSGARLAVQAVQELGVGPGAQDLERDLPPQARVARAVDLAHGPGPQATDDLVGTDARAGRQGICHEAAPAAG